MIKSVFILSRIVQFTATFMFILIFAMACSDNPSSSEPPAPDPTFGSIEVEVVTTGEDHDPDGYTISIQGGESKEVDPNGTVTFTQVATGNVVVAISEIPVHCQLEGDDSQALTLTDDEVRTIQFEIVCGPIFRDTILFMRRVGDDLFEYHIYSVSPDGENMRMVSDLILGPNSGVSSSPDGLQVLFSGTLTGSSTEQVYVMNADGSNLQNLTDTNSRDHTTPAWSPDGTRIALSINDLTSDDRNDIYIMNADGSSLVNITNNPGVSEFAPSWSPDGSQLVFQSVQPNPEGNGNLFSINKINADGTEPTTLLETEGVVLVNPKWSPTGDAIAFERFVIGGAEGPRQIHTMNPDGTNVRNITAMGGNPAVPTFNPSWSPDGRYIALHASSGGALNLFIMSRDGELQQNRLTNGANSQHHTSPSWSPFTRN